MGNMGNIGEYGGYARIIINRPSSELTGRISIVKGRDKSYDDVNLGDNHIHIEFTPTAIRHGRPEIVRLRNDSIAQGKPKSKGD